MKFTRFGSLSPQKQINHGLDTFHAPPQKYGFYAFPNTKIELFLLSATDEVGNSSNKSAWILDFDKNKIKFEDFYDGYPKIRKQFLPFIKKNKIKSRYICCESETDYMYYLKMPKHFEYNGYLWHHLKDFVEQADIIDEVNSWVKTDIKTYIKAFKESDAKERFRAGIKESSFKGVPSKYISGSNRDHYEVFIEKLK